MFNAGGPQMFFNMGGGPGFRVHQFGGGQPRRRPREANAQNEEPQGALGGFANLLPLILLFILPLLSSLLSSAIPPGPSIYFQSNPPHTMERTSQELKVPYFVNPAEVLDLSGRKLSELDKKADNHYITNLQYQCQMETRTRNQMVENAQGWFFPDEVKLEEARRFEMKACNRLDRLRYPRESRY